MAGGVQGNPGGLKYFVNYRVKNKPGDVPGLRVLRDGVFLYLGHKLADPLHAVFTLA